MLFLSFLYSVSQFWKITLSNCDDFTILQNYNKSGIIYQKWYNLKYRVENNALLVTPLLFFFSITIVIFFLSDNGNVVTIFSNSNSNEINRYFIVI